MPAHALYCDDQQQQAQLLLLVISVIVVNATAQLLSRTIDRESGLEEVALAAVCEMWCVVWFGPLAVNLTCSLFVLALISVRAFFAFFLPIANPQRLLRSTWAPVLP